MKRPHQFSPGSRFLIVFAAFVIVIAGIKTAEGIIVPMLLSVFIAVVCTPTLFWLRSKGFSQGLAMLLVVCAVIIVGALLVAFVGTSINDFSRAIPTYSGRLEASFSNLQTWLVGLGIPVPEKLAHQIFDPASAMKFVARLFSSLSAMFTNSFFILLTVTFILFETSEFPAKLHRILKNPQSSMLRLHKLVDSLNRYIVIKSLISLLTGIIIAVWLSIIGVDFPLLWGLLAFFFNFVPNIGSIIAAIPAVILAFIQSGLTLALLAAAGFAVVNVIIGSVIEPRIMGRGLGLSTLVVFLSLVLWGWILGPVGMILSIPLTMMVKVALEANEETRPIAILLGSKDDTPFALDSTQSPTEVNSKSD